MAMLRFNSVFVAQSLQKLPPYFTIIHKAYSAVNIDRLLNDITILQSVFNNKDKIPGEQWKHVRESVLLHHNVNESNIDVAIMNLCKRYGNMDQMSSYIDFLKTNNFDVNLCIIVKYLEQYTLKENLTESEKKEICDIYDSIREKYPLLDCITAENCISALCLTKRWQESEELLEMIKLTTEPHAKPYSAIIAAAFNNNNPKVGWKYFHEVSLNLKPQTHSYLAYINYCIRNFKDVKELKHEFSKLFYFWGNNYIIVPQSIATALMDTGQKLNWKGSYTSMNLNGICNHCSQKLNECSLTSEEFDSLSTLLLQNVIVGKDTYQKTTPKELKFFINYVESTKPYDVVIDGLNVAYAQAGQSPKLLAKQLRLVVHYLVSQKKKLLVIGRKHMNLWPKEDINYIKQNACVFFTKDLSQDDPYLLYATLTSGRSTDFVSRDLMRPHKHLLQNLKIKFLFKQWQVSHQYFVLRVNHNTGQVELQKPLKYHPIAQECPDGWHIPYNTCTTLNPPDTNEPPRNWLCLKYK
ncbi:mitochondrial ribonuclease P catalytic subunit [Cephus cinctus]|uniref:Mitochondrial ribonuclease P catalytic subunit n=1 Tax=Cephus cinctus TaxID=211228 RepID=A0AAJ7BTQ2_CEPCN|nr:mitochondrial ribonuclease P catalytic subunit [Cephus cinctus]XP_015594052.1 mitochondrial ribonuclease P catalytic subunit [Cephus cinctus]XP_015594053.1 mitochondrial ribonuclease P catalytic subunit [Cephus cinctus]XP_024940175.1 mitochondrial ribonuclease P catalytic subunit [Cephus cinctus]XP_024940176.1 mitochondrial ribonuclease P catalytic subunit [Cephus cinctus]XP_024940177.1 mitochondrial ribonuclease P catalytic subunit [Cephus cinctus]